MAGARWGGVFTKMREGPVRLWRSGDSGGRERKKIPSQFDPLTSHDPACSAVVASRTSFPVARLREKEKASVTRPPI